MVLLQVSLVTYLVSLINDQNSLVPGTARFTLEELDTVFSKSWKEVFQFGLREVDWFCQRCFYKRHGNRP